VSDENKVRRLQGLLERVQRNARAPRMRAAHPAPTPAEVVAEPGGGSATPEPRAAIETRDRSPMPAAARAPSPAPAPVAEVIQAPDEVNRISVEIFEDVELIEGEEIVELPSDLPLVDARVEPEAPRELPYKEAPAAAPAAGLGVVDIDFDDMEDVAAQEPPASSRRAKVAAESMDAALSDAAEQLEEDREVPIKTPPPESGPQAAMPPAQVLQAPAMPQFEDMLEQRPAAAFAERTPSPAEVEIAEPEPPPVSAARATAEARLEPEIMRRAAPPAAAKPASFVHAAQAFQPQTFVELLDSSLALGR